MTLIGKYSNKVLDLLVKSKFRQGCNHWKGKENTDEFKSWFEAHEEQWACNHSDTKTFKSLLDMQPYSDNLIVKKSECVGHVKKR